MGFRPGDLVEFRSSQRGGCWLPAFVDRRLHGRRGRSLRLRVGPKVYVIRQEHKCRVVTLDRMRGLLASGGDRTGPLPPGEGSSEGGGALPAGG